VAANRERTRAGEARRLILQSGFAASEPACIQYLHSASPQCLVCLPKLWQEKLFPRSSLSLVGLTFSRSASSAKLAGPRLERLSRSATRKFKPS
jgi:hypothetical protein